MHIRYTLTAYAVGIALLTNPLQAGGPILEEPEGTAEAVVAGDRDNKALPWIIGGIIVLGLLAGGGGSSDVCNTPEPETGGC
jgi:hypothetical protein